MDQGVDSVLNVSEQTSSLEGFDYEITYSIDDVSYTIYYSFVEHIEETTENDPVTTNTSNEITTLTDDHEEETTAEEDESTENDDEEDEDDVEDKENNEFQLVGLMVINDVNYELTGANEIEDEEQKMWFETIDTNNNGNYVRVEIKNENEEQKFEIETLIDGVETKSEINLNKKMMKLK